MNCKVRQSHGEQGWNHRNRHNDVAQQDYSSWLCGNTNLLSQQTALDAVDARHDILNVQEFAPRDFAESDDERGRVEGHT